MFFFKPIVSVIIPCYKQAQYLPEAVESVVNQTFKEWEIIIVNDGSPDNTKEVAESLIEKYKDKKIKLINKENGGLSDARNAGIREASGEYIFPLDSDDKISPNALFDAYNIIEKDNIDIVFLDGIEFGESENKLICAGTFDVNYLKYQNAMNYCALYKKNVWEKVSGYNKNMKYGYEDWNFWLSCAANKFNVYFMRGDYFKYRKTKNSMYSNSIKHHDYLVARIILNHEDLYSREEIELAKRKINETK